MAAELLVTRQGHALLLTLREPATRNALSPTACAAGVEALDKAAQDPAIRCIVLRGDGPHFCSGGDLRRLLRTRALGVDVGARQQADHIDGFHAFVLALADCPKPIIAAVEGHAAGGGFSLALACDLIVAARDARFTLSYAKVGLSPDGGALWQLARRLPPGRVAQAAWLAQPLDAAYLHNVGVVAELVEPGQALNAALALAAALAAQAPHAVTSVKGLLRHAGERTLREHLDAERAQFVQNLFHAHGGEGLDAFVAKRPARFD